MYVGEEIPELTYTVDPQLVAGDEMTGSLNTSADGKAKGTFDIVQKENEEFTAGNNYEITFVSGTLTVNEKSSGGGGGGSVSDPVADLVKMIEALDPNAATYADDAQKVVDAYNALTADQKADKRLTDEAVAKKLAAAQEAAKSEEQKKADQKAADEASKLIEALLDPSQATEAEAMAAYNAYMALTDAQKALLSPAAQEKVAEYAYYYESQYAAAQKVTKFKVKNVKTRKAKATWKKTAGISGYQLTYKAKGTKTKKVTLKASAVKKVVKKLKKGKKYTFRIRTFTKVYNPYTGSYEKVYGSWAKRTVKIKK